jgi:hypothetical protein
LHDVWSMFTASTCIQCTIQASTDSPLSCPSRRFEASSCRLWCWWHPAQVAFGPTVPYRQGMAGREFCVWLNQKKNDGYLLGTLWKRIIWSNSDNWWSMVDFEFPYLQPEDPEGSDGVCCFDSIFWTSFHGYPCITQGLNAVLSHSWINSVAIICYNQVEMDRQIKMSRTNYDIKPISQSTTGFF